MMGSTSRSECRGLQIFSPVMGWSFMTAHSAGVRSLPFFRISSGTAILPRSCRYPPRFRARMESSVRILKPSDEASHGEREDFVTRLYGRVMGAILHHAPLRWGFLGGVVF